MEQKKILWIVVAICVFVLIIFGAALLLYAPSRSTGQNLKQAVAVTPATLNGIPNDASRTQSQVDPDSWVREPGNAPGLDTNLKPSPGDINLTIVNGDNAGANYGTLDVSGLTDAKKPLAPDSAQQLPLSAIPGQTPPESHAATTAPSTPSVSSARSSQSAVKTEGPAEVKSAAKESVAAAPANKPAVAKATEKAAPKKTVTEYWLQTGSFSSKINAEKARESLASRYFKAEIFTKDIAGATTYRVRVGPYKSKTEAEYWLGTVKEIPEFSGTYISEVKTKK